MRDPSSRPHAGARDAGLCFTCVHARVVDTTHSRFWLCTLAAVDPRFEKYPRLPVLACSGYVPRGGDAPEPANETGASG